MGTFEDPDEVRDVARVDRRSERLTMPNQSLAPIHLRLDRTVELQR